MKTRTNFVSNSSSSASVTITTLANHERALAELTDYHRAVVEFIGEKQTIAGLDVFMIGSMSSMDSDYTFDYFEYDGDDPHEDGPYEARFEYEEEVDRRPLEVLSWSVG